MEEQVSLNEIYNDYQAYLRHLFLDIDFSDEFMQKAWVYLIGTTFLLDTGYTKDTIPKKFQDAKSMGLASLYGLEQLLHDVLLGKQYHYWG